MERRRLGGTARTVSVIGLGLAAIGRPGYINLGHEVDLDGRTDPSALRHHAGEILDAAAGAGVTYFDAARSYGRAEEFLAHWLAGRPDAADLTVGSKWGYEYVAGWRTDADVHETKEHSIGVLDRQYGESRAHLGDRLAVYQIHSATRESGVLADAAVLDRLAELRDSGVAIGLSTSGPDQAATIRDAIGIEVDGAPLFATVQSTWNLLEPSAGPALAEAADAGLGVIVKEAVANGRLTARDPELARRIDRGVAGRSPDQLAIAAAVHQPWSSVVLSGAASIEQLRSNLAATSVTPDELAVLPDLSEPPDEYWRTRSALAWT